MVIAPDDLGLWSLHCFCLGARSTPHQIVRQGTNGALLAAVGTESFRVDLPPHHDGQLDQLADYGLIGLEQGRVRRLFPVLGPDIILPLRAATDECAQVLSADVAGELERLRKAMAEAGWDRWFRTLFLGHVLDGLLWDALRQRIALPQTALTPDHPHWRGVFWAVYPGRAGAIGTNEVRRDGFRLTMMWSERTDAALRSLRQSEWIGGFLECVAGRQDMPPSEAIVSGLAREDGSIVIPLLGTARGAEVAAMADRLAESVVRSILRQDPLLSRLPDLKREEAHVILLHELIWSVQAAFDQQNRFESCVSELG